jgi:hypothetical protein
MTVTYINKIPFCLNYIVPSLLAFNNVIIELNQDIHVEILTRFFDRADYWVSQQRHWCKYCKKYVANNKPVSMSLQISCIIIIDPKEN